MPRTYFNPNVRNILLSLGIFIIVLASILNILSYFNMFGKITNKIAVVEIKGIILPECPKYGENCVSSEFIVNTLKNIDSDPTYSAILLYIDSGGGEVNAIYEIIDELRKIKKPVYSFIRTTATSGAFWIATKTKEIFAQPFALVGSIGVKLSLLDLSELLKKLGVKYYDLSKGKFKSAGNPFKNITKEELEEFSKIVDVIYKNFTLDVILSRNITNQSVINDILESKIFLAIQAKNMGLVDYICDFNCTIEKIKKELNLTDVELVWFSPKEYSLLDVLLSYINLPIFSHVFHRKFFLLLT